MRRALHVEKLERGKLHHNEVALLHLCRIAKQRMTDVAAKPYRFPRRAKYFGNDAGGGRLAVAAGHADDRAGTDFKKDLHFRGDDAPLFARSGKRRYIRPHTGRTENNVRVEIVQISLAKPQLCSHGRKLRHARAERFTALSVAGNGPDAIFTKQRDQRRIGNADAQHRSGLPFEREKIVPDGHGKCSFRGLSFTDIV